MKWLIGSKRYGVFVGLVVFQLLLVIPCKANLLELRETQAFLVDTITYYQHNPTYPFPPVHVQSQTLHFAPFETSLGTLQNAYLSYQGTYGMELVVKAGLAYLPSGYSFYQRPVGAIAAFQYDLLLSASGVSGQNTIASDYMTAIVNGTAIVDNYNSSMFFFNINGSGPKDVPDHTYGQVGGRYLFRPWVSTGSLDTPLISLSDGLNVLGGTVDVTLEKDISVFLVPIVSSEVPPG